MPQERVINSAMISIENGICEELNIKELVPIFINLKTRFKFKLKFSSNLIKRFFV